MDEDQVLEITGVSVSDPDVGTDFLLVDLSVDEGRLSLGTLAGLDFYEGDGTDDAALSFVGTADDLNAALATLSYLGDPHFSGGDFLSIMVDDLGPEWISCYGAEGIETPHIDALAKGGMRFENVYSMPKCTPASRLEH